MRPEAKYGSSNVPAASPGRVWPSTIRSPILPTRPPFSLGRRWPRRVLAAHRPPATDRAHRPRRLGGHEPHTPRTCGDPRPLAADAVRDPQRTVRPRRDHRAGVRGRQKGPRPGALIAERNAGAVSELHAEQGRPKVMAVISDAVCQPRHEVRAVTPHPPTSLAYNGGSYKANSSSVGGWKMPRYSSMWLSVIARPPLA